MQSLISTPLIFPKVTALSGWEEVWSANAKFVRKHTSNHNVGQAFWKGFDIYVKPGFDAQAYSGYAFENVNCPELFPSIFNNLDMLPIEVTLVRAMSSISRVIPHCDSTTNDLSVRTILVDNNPRQTFYYQFNNKQSYQHLPEDTNTWMYWDNNSKHGTDFYQGHNKILIAYYGTMKENYVDYFNQSTSLYKDFVIYD
jgi:hypothetical protein